MLGSSLKPQEGDRIASVQVEIMCRWKYGDCQEVNLRAVHVNGPTVKGNTLAKADVGWPKAAL